MKMLALVCCLLAVCSCAGSSQVTRGGQSFARAHCDDTDEQGRCTRCVVRASDVPRDQRRNLTSTSKAMRFVCENMAPGVFRATADVQLHQEVATAWKGPPPRYALAVRLEIVGEGAGAMSSREGSDAQPCPDDAPCTMEMKCAARPSKDGDIAGYLVIDACQLGSGRVSCALTKTSRIEIARAGR